MDWWYIYYKDTLLSPFENTLSSRDYIPHFENQLLQRNSTDGFSIRACSYIRLFMSCEYTPVLSCALLNFYLLQSPRPQVISTGFTLRSMISLGFPVSSLGLRDSWTLICLWTLSPFASCCVEQLMLNSAAWWMLGQWPLCVILWIFTLIRVLLLLLSCLEFVLCYQLFQPLHRARCVYDMKCTEEG